MKISDERLAEITDAIAMVRDDMNPKVGETWDQAHRLLTELQERRAWEAAGYIEYGLRQPDGHIYDRLSLFEVESIKELGDTAVQRTVAYGPWAEVAADDS